MKSFIVAIVIAACSVARVTSLLTPVTQCTDNSGPLPLYINMNNCTNLPCAITKEGTIDSLFEFTAVSDAKFLTATIEYSENGLKTGSFIDNDICSALTSGTCPVKKGDKVDGTCRNTLVKIPPTVRDLTYRITIYDENKVVQTCFDITWHVTGA